MADETRAALVLGHVNYVTVIAIEGYPHLISDGIPAKVQASWAGTDYAANVPLDGAFLELQRHQAIHPYKAFAGAAGGNATISVVADATDRLGIDVARTNAGAETFLVNSLDRDDTTITVKSTTGFPAAGELWIGNECIAYTGVTATTFTGCTRGKYSPFLTESSGRFAAHHRAGFVDYGTNIEPVVSQYRRSWTGAQVGIWIVRVKTPLTGELDLKADARCIYAGTIDEPQDDPNHNATIIKCTPMVQRVHDAELYVDQFKAIIQPGIWIEPFLSLHFKDATSAGASAGTTLTTVASGAVGYTQMNAGYWRIDQLTSFINDWLAGAKFDGLISGTYTLQSPDGLNGTTITRLKWKNASGAAGWAMQMPSLFAVAFGWIDPNSVPNGTTTISDNSNNATSWQEKVSGFPPLQVYVGSSQQTQARVQLYRTAGVAVNQASMIPSVPYGGPYTNVTYDTICLFQLGDGTILLGALVVTPPGPGGVLSTTAIWFFPHLLPDLTKLRLAYDIAQNTAPLEVKQVICLSGPAATLLAQIFYSTGTLGFNSATYDTLGYGLGLGIPADLLGTSFINSLTASAMAQTPMHVWITKPSKLVDLIDSDLVLLGLYLIWKDEGLQFAEFATPTAGAAVAALAEGNKATALGDKDEPRAPTVLTSEWVKPVIKIESGYDHIEDKYTRPPYVIEDRTSIDDMNGDRSSATIRARNIHPLDLPPVLDAFKARLGFFTRPFHKIIRSLSLENFETIAPLSIVTLTDDSARDPATGRRRATIGRPALILSHMSDLGGPQLGGGDARALAGEVTLWLSPTPRAAAYSPCAEVDETANSGGFVNGYNAATKTFRTKPYEHTDSATSLLRDAEYFTGIDKVNFIEVDPEDPTAAQVEPDTVVSVSTTDVVVTTGFVPTPGKRYRMVTRQFTTAQASQQVNCYFADDTDALIQNVAPPYRYEIPSGAIYTAESVSSRAELVPTVAYGDGVGLDTGHQRAAIRTLNQLIDTKTAHQSPTLGKKVSNVVGGWLLSHLRLVFVGFQIPTFTRRYLEVAPHFRSMTGASVSLRMTLSARRPVDTTLNNIVRPGPYSEATFTTSSLTFVTPAHAQLDLGVISLGGWAWLMVEIGGDCETFGPAKAHESART